MALGHFVDWSLRVSAVSYLNTWPLVWGFEHGPQKGLYDLRFDLPSACADAVGSGEADMGLVPCAELDRLELDFLPQLGIACDGPVRSILLISKRPFAEIRTLAADSGSRTSVALTRIVLAEQYGCRPSIAPQPPKVDDMLAGSDAALIIGDPALRLAPETPGYQTLDLGAAWTSWTGLPMVFAVWAGKSRFLTPQVAQTFSDSYAWGRQHMDEIVKRAECERGFPAALAREYLTRHIVFELSPKHLKGLQLYRDYVRALSSLPAQI
jgi:chorismate dehydratase